MLTGLTAVAVVAVALGASGSTGKGGALPAPEIAFTVTPRGGDYGRRTICVGRANDLSHARRLAGPGWYEGVAWAASGTRIAVAGGKSRPDHTYPIRVERADGTGTKAVTTPRLATEDDSSPAWSPDGTQIAFSRSVFFGPGTDYRRAGVWVVRVGADRAPRQLTRQPAGTLAWSPARDVIAADVGADIGEEIDLVRPNGRVEGRIVLRSLGGFDRGVSWSPDGKRLAVGGGAIVDRTGRLVGRYAPPSTNAVVSRLPSWSQDGKTIVFAHARTTFDARTNIRSLGNADLYLAPATAGKAVRLTRTPGISEDAPVFRPGVTPGTAVTSRPCLVQGRSR